MSFIYELILKGDVSEAIADIDQMAMDITEAMDSAGLHFGKPVDHDLRVVGIDSDVLQDFQDKTSTPLSATAHFLFSVDAIDADDFPFSAFFLRLVLKKYPPVLIVSEDGEIFDEEKFLEFFSMADWLDQELKALAGKTIADLQDMDLARVFRHKTLKDYIPKNPTQILAADDMSIEELLLSENPDHLRLANRKMNLKGLPVSDLIKGLIKRADSDDQRALLALKRLQVICEVGISEDIALRHTQPFYLTHDKTKADYIENARNLLSDFLSRR